MSWFNLGSYFLGMGSVVLAIIILAVLSWDKSGNQKECNMMGCHNEAKDISYCYGCDKERDVNSNIEDENKRLKEDLQRFKENVRYFEEQKNYWRAKAEEGTPTYKHILWLLNSFDIGEFEIIGVKYLCFKNTALFGCDLSPKDHWDAIIELFNTKVARKEKLLRDAALNKLIDAELAKSKEEK